MSAYETMKQVVTDLISPQLAAIDGKIATIETRFAGLEGKFAGLEGKLGVMEGRLGIMDGKLDALSARVDGLRAEFHSEIRRLDEKMSVAIDVHERLAALEARISRN